MYDLRVTGDPKPRQWVLGIRRSVSGKRILTHLLAWSILIVLMIWLSWLFVTSRGVTDRGLALALACWSGTANVLIQVACYYWVTILIVPAVLNRRWLRVIVQLIMIYVGSTWGNYHLQLSVGQHWAGVSQRFDERTRGYEGLAGWPILVDLYNFFITWQFTYSVIFVPLCIKVIKDIYTTQNQALALELNLLRAQINPHFIFNTLNNIYSIVEEKDAYGGELLLKFSNIIRNTFDQTESNVIPLPQEINSLRDFIELEKIRHDCDLSVQLDISLNETGPSYFVPPLLLISFVENAFKHGVNAIIGSAWVRIKIVTTQSTLHFEVTNNKPVVAVAVSTKRVVRVHRVGLKNIKRRLELLYPRTHQLIIADLTNIYSVELTLTDHGKPDHLPVSRRRTAGPSTS